MVAPLAAASASTLTLAACPARPSRKPLRVLEVLTSTATGLIGRTVGSFHPRSIPVLARTNYRRELLSSVLFGVGLAAIEGGVISVIVKTAFEGVVPAVRLNYIVALLAAAPEFANITSFFWAALAHARPKVRFINAAQVAAIACLLVVGLAPRTEPGLYVLAAAAVLGRVFMSAVVTLRSTVWRANYPRHARARITGKLATALVVTTATVGYALGRAMDHDDSARRWLLPLVALVSLAGVLAYSRVRVRREPLLLREERDGHRHDRPSINPASVLRVLRADPRFAWFLASLFVLGLGNIMLSAPLVITLRDQFRMDYAAGILVAYTIPLLVMPWFIPLWARYLDRVHVARFRAFHSWVFVAAQAIILLGVQTHQVALLHLGMAVQGMGFGGGTLAWNLGHLDFAPRHRASQYMGAHVTLNGVRGLLAPFIAVGLYQALESRAAGLGNWVFAVSVALCVAGAVGFGLLARHMGPGARLAPREPL